MDILDDIFLCPDMVEDIPINHSYRDDTYEKYSKFIADAQTPIFNGSPISLLDSILESM